MNTNIYMKEFMEILHAEHTKYIQKLLDKLMESKKIPAYDTHVFSDLYARLIFSESKIKFLQLIEEENVMKSSNRFYEFRERMIDMALSGNIPGK